MTKVSPQATLQFLLDGNRRFVEDRSERPRADSKRRRDLVGGQQPMAAVLGCSDSRVPPELVFDQGLGDLFVVRSAGQLADDSNLGSLEFAVAVLGVRLIVVLGHEDCGAVSAAVASAASGKAPDGYVASVTSFIDTGTADPDMPLETWVNATILEHTRRMADRVRNAAPVLSARAASGDLLVVAALYRLSDGKVVVLD